MPQVTFQVKVLTPLFLAGADQTQAELRAPTFRGLMRYWYRALVGGVVGTNSKGFEQVMENEKAVFGATDTGSPVAIRIANTTGEAKEFTEKVSVNVGGKWQATGKGYLLWSMSRSGSIAKNNVKPARWYFPSGTTFQVKLANRSNDETKLQKAVASFWLLTHLGSVGSRSRRCAGSLAATITAKDASIPQGMRFDIPASIADLQKQLADGIHAAQGLISRNNVGTELIRDLAPFDIISRGTCRIWIVQDRDRPWNSAEEAMKSIGEDLQNYRGNINPIQRRRVFGLPLRDVDNRARRASPLMLRITELQGNKYVCVAVVFKTAATGVSPKDYELVEKWASEYPGSVEVRI